MALTENTFSNRVKCSEILCFETIMPTKKEVTLFIVMCVIFLSWIAFFYYYGHQLRKQQMITMKGFIHGLDSPEQVFIKYKQIVLYVFLQNNV